MEEVENKNNSRKILIVAGNAIIMIAYTLFIRYNGHNDLGDVISTALMIALHISVCLIASIFIYRKEFLLSALVVLLVGFSTCWIAFTH